MRSFNALVADKKVIAKILHCLKHDTQMGWLIDPTERAIFVYYLNQTPELFDAPEQILPAPVFASELKLKVGDLFGWLLE